MHLLMYITGAKFKGNHFNISEDILHFFFIIKFCFPLDTTDELISFTQNFNIPGTIRDISKRKTPCFFSSKSLSNKLQLFFYFLDNIKH